MKKLPRPECSAADTYLACLEGVADPSFRNRLSECHSDIMSAETEYIEKGKSATLFMLPFSDLADEEVVLGEVTQEEFKKLYSRYMVPRQKPGRKFYDRILVLANGKCPLCNMGHASTLDHYLPKSRFPVLSVFPVNLVPACRDCNYCKNSAVATGAEDQVLHPYFDEDKFYSEKWIYAEVSRTEPPSISFYPAPPTHWDAISKKRAAAHFSEFNLAHRYSTEAGNELATLISQFERHMRNFKGDGIVQYLLDIAESIPLVNDWRAVMYEAMAGDEWFCDRFGRG